MYQIEFRIRQIENGWLVRYPHQGKLDTIMYYKETAVATVTGVTAVIEDVVKELSLEKGKSGK